MKERARPGAVAELAALVPVAMEVWGPLDRRTVLLRSTLAAATGMAGQAAEAVTQIEALLSARASLDADVVETLESNLSSWRKRSQP